MAVKKTLKRGFTLVELMIVVAIIGVLAALAIYGVRKYMANAKTAEARNSLGQMSKDAAAAFARENMTGDIVALGGTAAPSNQLCSSAGNTVPAAKASIAGKKYQSAPAEWATGGVNEGWACLKFNMRDPQYFMYSYTASGTLSAAGGKFVSTANGDLDGDGTLSTFSINGEIQASSGELVCTVAPGIEEDLPEE